MENRLHLTGAQAVVATLCAHSIDTIFGIPGFHTLPLYHAIYHEPRLRHILARHEQGAGFMAEGYARATGRPGVVSTITGPGATNVTTPLASAYADSIPLLVISSSLTSSGRGELHEIKDQLGMMEALTGWARAVTRVEEIPSALHEALCTLKQGRPRGAYLQIPFALLEASALVDIPTTIPSPIRGPIPDQDAIEKAARLLRTAHQPVILAGAGITMAGANTQLARLAEKLQAPVVLGPKSHDILPTTHPLVLTTNDTLVEEVNTFIANADLALVIGSKLGYSRTGDGRLRMPANLIHIDIDASEIGREYPVTQDIVADAGLALDALLMALDDLQREHCTRQTELDQTRQALLSDIQSSHSEGFALLEALQAALPPERIVVADMTLLGYACAQWLPVYEPRTFIHPIELCTIGCGLPLALGAKLAQPEQPVIALCGDGGFLLNASELATAAQENIPVIIIIFNDTTFATVKLEQCRRFESKYIATDLLTPDYVALAHAFHIRSVRTETPAELGTAIQAALQHNGPTLIDVSLPPRTW